MRKHRFIMQFATEEAMRDYIKLIRGTLPESVGFYHTDALDFSSGRAEKDTYILASHTDRSEANRFEE